MYKIFLLLTGLLLSILTESKAQSIRVATYNIRYDTPADSLNAWKYRLPRVKDLIRYHDFEIFGIQEGLDHQVKQLKEQLQGYEYYGVGRDDGKQSGEFSAIFYKKDKFKKQDNGTFWLAENTTAPNKGWDAALPRICSWIKLSDQKGFSFYVFNVHFDHRGVMARKESAKLVLQKMKEIAGESPAILMGDFNFSQQDESFKLIENSGFLNDTYFKAKVSYAPNGTFNGFDISSDTQDRIDHIFVTSHFTVNKYGILTDTYSGRFPSDHFPVVVDLEYSRK